jgi:hypothetical protein
MQLCCGICGATSILDEQKQKAILKTLTEPGQTAIVECPCRKSQFVLAARAKRRR